MVNTLLFVGVGVNVKMFLAFLLSGFFMRRRWWIKALLVLFMLPWALPALPAFLSIHWMLIGDWRLPEQRVGDAVRHRWSDLVQCPTGSRWAPTSLAYIWKWMPFWTLIFLAGRMAIPQDIYEAAEVDGASGIRRFTFVTFPLLANLYLVSTLLSTLWTIGDFTTVYFVSSGAPALQTEVLATLGFRMAFDLGQPAPRRGRDDVGAAAADPDDDPADAAAADDRGAVVSLALTAGWRGAPVAPRPAASPEQRGGRRALVVVLMFWTLLPVYNMVLIALERGRRRVHRHPSGRPIRRSRASR